MSGVRCKHGTVITHRCRDCEHEFDHLPPDVQAKLIERDAIAERAAAAEAEVEALKHDIERHLEIASREGEARIAAEDRADKLERALHALTYSVGLIVDRWNAEHPTVPHPETKRIAAAREALARPVAPPTEGA